MWRKGLIKKKGSYPLLPMKKDQTNCTKVYKWYPLAWEWNPSRSDISLGMGMFRSWCRGVGGKWTGSDGVRDRKGRRRGHTMTPSHQGNPLIIYCS